MPGLALFIVGVYVNNTFMVEVDEGHASEWDDGEGVVVSGANMVRSSVYCIFSRLISKFKAAAV